MTSLPLDPSAAVALGLAGTAMPFAGSADAEAERWLRILRVHGDASLILSSVGFTEAPREEPGAQSAPPETPGGEAEKDELERIRLAASEAAAQRGAHAVDTSDLLVAVARVYGDAFDRVLQAHGASREQVFELLDLESAANAPAQPDHE